MIKSQYCDVVFEKRSGYLFEEFILGPIIGKGKYSYVFEAQRKKTFFKRAVKVLLVDNSEGEGVLPDKSVREVDLEFTREAIYNHEKPLPPDFEALPRGKPSNIHELKMLFDENIKYKTSISSASKEVENLLRGNKSRFGYRSDRAGWIVQIYDWWYENNLLFLSFELLEGTFASLIRPRIGLITEHQLWVYARELARAYSYMTKNNIIRSDLHGNNVFLAQNSRYETTEIVLGDFGRSTSLSFGNQKDDPALTNCFHNFCECLMNLFHSSKIYDGIKDILMRVIDEEIEKEKSAKEKNEHGGEKIPSKLVGMDKLWGEKRTVFDRIAELVVERFPACVLTPPAYIFFKDQEKKWELKFKKQEAAWEKKFEDFKKEMLEVVDGLKKKLDETTKKLDETTKKLDETKKKLDETKKNLDETTKNLDETNERLKKYEEGSQHCPTCTCGGVK